MLLTGRPNLLTLVQNEISSFAAKRSRVQFKTPFQATRTVNSSIIASETLYLVAYMPAQLESEKLLKTKYNFSSYILISLLTTTIIRIPYPVLLFIMPRVQ